MKSLIPAKQQRRLRMASKLTELYREMKGLRKDVEEIKEMLIPEVPASQAEKRAIAGGRREFLRGEIERIPLPDNSVDVVISNCVINLSSDKDAVLREAFRVLKPGGRFAVSDVVTRGEMLPEVRKSLLLWVGCVAGSLEENDYRVKLASAGFEQIDLEPTRIYNVDDAREFLAGQNIDIDAIAPQVDGKIMSAFVRAVKPRSN